MKDTRFIIDVYNKYQNNENVIDTFTLHDHPYCIREVSAHYDWGVPQLDAWVEQDLEQDYSYQHSYDTLEDAREFARTMKRLNG